MQNKQENLTIEDFRFQKAGKRYEEQMRRLWAECFPEDRDSGFIPFFFEQIYDEERTYLALYDNKVCSMVYAPLMKYHFGGVDFTAAYIQGVATVPEFRNLHLANTLLRRALDDLNRQGVPFGILKPFNVGFYEKSGWRVFSRMAEVPLEAVDIPNEYSDCSATGDSGKSADVLMLSRQKKESAARGFLKNLKKFWREKRQTVSSERMDCILAASADVGTGEKFSSNSVKSGENLQLAEIKNYEEYLTDLAAVFEYWQRNSHNAYPLRDSRGWSLLLRDHFNDGGRLFAAFYRDKMLAYCLYLEQEAEIFLRETAAVNDDAFYRLLVFAEKLSEECFSERGGIKPIVLHLPVNESYCEAASEEVFAMVRVISAETLLSALDLGLAADEAVFLEISDDVVDGNNGCLLLQSHADGSDCRRIEKQEAPENFLRQIEANRLTELLSEWYNFNRRADGSSGDLSPEIQGCAYFNEYF